MTDASRGQGERLLPWGSRRRSFFRAPFRARRIIVERGWGAFLGRLARPWTWLPRLWERAAPEPEGMTPVERYLLWSSIHHRNPRVQRRKRRAARRLDGPVVSVLVPLFDPEPGSLGRAIASVREQLHERWELCLADDGSTDRRHLAALEELAARDRRIKLRELPANQGISAATNAALELADGDYVAMIDQDDELAPDALYEVARLVEERPELDLIYTDEDKIDEDGRVLDYFFKPDWSPDLELSTNYVNHLTVVRTELLRKLGGFRGEYDGAQDYDVVLRVTESTDRIAHIPLPLYSWRSTGGSVAASEKDAKPWAYESGRRALEDTVHRRGLAATVRTGSFPGAYRVRYEVPDAPDVAVVVDRPAIETRSGWAARMNAAARAERGAAYLLFMHGDTEAPGPEAIEALVEHAQRPDVGVVGGHLAGRDGRVDHEGLIVGAERHVPGDYPAVYRPAGELVRNVSAVSGACLMIRADLFEAMGGFDERMDDGSADVDLCLRAREEGLAVVCTPHARLRHHPGEIRGPAHSDPRFRRRWGGYRDPYYNPNLDLVHPYLLRI